MTTLHGARTPSSFDGWRTSQPWTFQPQASTPDLSTPDFSTMNFSTPDFSTMNFWTMGLKKSWLKSLGLKYHLSRRLKDISTPDVSTMNFSTLWFKNSWLKSLGLKGPELKLGVEKSGVEMSFDHLRAIMHSRDFQTTKSRFWELQHKTSTRQIQA